MFLYTYIPVNPFNFHKYGNHCTLLSNRHVHLQNVYGILLEFINLRVLYK